MDQIAYQLKKLSILAVLLFVVAIPWARAQNTCDKKPMPTLPCIDQPYVGQVTITGKLTAGGAAPVGTQIILKIDGNKIDLPAPAVINANGTFSFAGLSALKSGNTIEVVQSAPAGDTGGVQVQAPQNTCDKKSAPCLDQPSQGQTKVTGSWTAKGATAPAGAEVKVILQINDTPIGNPAAVSADGTFSFTGLSPLNSYNTIEVVQSGGTAGTTGKVQVQSAAQPSGTTVILIGGVEQSGYSSLGQNSNPFVNVYIEGPSTNRLTGWGRVRLLSAPQPSTQGIVSTFTDPTGQLTTQSYSKVGESMDFVIGPTLKLIPHWSLIAGFGATTPLSSQNVTLTYVAPSPGTVECSTMVNRFSAKNGYIPSLAAAPAGSSTCLLGGYTDVAFSNQDRSNFLLKYGGGFRTSYPFACTGGTTATPCSSSYGVLDLTFGQDESVTGGVLRSVVFKMDGVLPIPTGNSAWLYVFGSVYLRLNRNQNNSPLILNTATGVTIPSPTVIVLPLLQPNRDYFRLGVGINLSQIFCKLSTSTCPNKSSGSAAPTAQ
jgi:hypothetical protein